MAADLTIAPRRARAVADQWARLAASTPAPAPFDPASADVLPTPVARWVRHTIAPGTPLSHTLLLEMDGLIRLGAWRPFTARQVLATTHGFVWAASARFGPVPVVGYDRWADGQGEMRWRLAGLVPVMRGTGPDVTRSAAGRLAAETFVSPTGALHPAVGWRCASTTPAFWDDPHVFAGMLSLHLDPDAELASRPHEVVGRSVDWLVRHLGLATEARVLDLGCGPGSTRTVSHVGASG